MARNPHIPGVEFQPAPVILGKCCYCGQRLHDGAIIRLSGDGYSHPACHPAIRNDVLREVFKDGIPGPEEKQE